MDVFLARQPIFNKDKQVNSYEILYRSGYMNSFDGTDGNKASVSVIIDTFQTFGIENLTNGKPVFINFTQDLICEGVATLFPKNFLVVEILETVEPSENIIEKCVLLKKMGYKIALDDFIFRLDYDPLIQLADIIKVDFMSTSIDEIKTMVRFLKKYNVELLAEKIETHEEFEIAQTLGFTLFQGYFLTKPEIIKTKRLNPLNANCLELITEINKSELNFDKISAIIMTDVSLTYYLLKLVNSSVFGFRTKIKSVARALAILGEKEIKKWVYIISLTRMGQNMPHELTKTSLIRAKFCELLASKTKYKDQSEDMFLLGLFSLLDVMLDRPFSEILDELQASNLVKRCLTEADQEICDIYNIILSIERANWDEVISYSNKIGLDYYEVNRLYLDALIMCNKF